MRSLRMTANSSRIYAIATGTQYNCLSYSPSSEHCPNVSTLGQHAILNIASFDSVAIKVGLRNADMVIE